MENKTKNITQKIKRLIFGNYIDLLKIKQMEDKGIVALF